MNFSAGETRRKFDSGSHLKAVASEVEQDALESGLDQAAFEAFYQQSQGLIYSICRRILKDEEDALDAFQSTYARVISICRAPNSSVAATDLLFLTRVMAAREADNLRKRRGRKQGHEIAVESALETPAPGVGAREMAARVEMAEKLERIMAQLPDDYRVPIVLHYFHDMSHREIAEALDRPVNTISSLIRRGLRKLDPLTRRAGIGSSLAAVGLSAGALTVFSPPTTATAASMFEQALRLPLQAPMLSAKEAVAATGLFTGHITAWSIAVACVLAALAAIFALSGGGGGAPSKVAPVQTPIQPIPTGVPNSASSAAAQALPAAVAPALASPDSDDARKDSNTKLASSAVSNRARAVLSQNSLEGIYVVPSEAESVLQAKPPRTINVLRVLAEAGGYKYQTGQVSFDPPYAASTWTDTDSHFSPQPGPEEEAFSASWKEVRGAAAVFVFNDKNPASVYFVALKKPIRLFSPKTVADCKTGYLLLVLVPPRSFGGGDPVYRFADEDDLRENLAAKFAEANASQAEMVEVIYDTLAISKEEELRRAAIFEDVTTAYDRMKSVSAAVEGYLDLNDMPILCSSDIRENLNAAVAKEHPGMDWRIPTFIQPDRYSIAGRDMTDDPFQAEIKRPFCYFTNSKGPGETTPVGWIIWSCGPDKKYDTDWTKYDAAQNSEPFLARYRYDPTNGVESAGDLIVAADAGIVSLDPAERREALMVKSKVSRAKADMRSLATAIESYYVDFNEYPASSLDKTQNINKTLAQENPERNWGLPTFLGYPPMSLTTPISYITSYFSDPFESEVHRSYCYYATPPNPDGSRTDSWIVWSPGPDGDYDTDWMAFDPMISNSGAGQGGDTVVRDGLTPNQVGSPGTELEFAL